MFDFFRRFFCSAVFGIRFKDGKATLFKGKATKAFLNDCLEVVLKDKLDPITIYGINSSYGVKLDFSSNTPESSRQRFRNI